MQFRSVSDLSADIVAWSAQLPRDIDLVVGVPRSGMLAASLLALHMDRPLADLDGYVAGTTYLGGKRTRARHGGPVKHALVVDDSLLTGRAMREAREKVAAAGLTSRTSFGAVYVDRASTSQLVDQHYAVLPAPRIFEWNVLQHERLGECCMDIDGVLCRDPEVDENDDGDEYSTFLDTVPPQLVPGEEVGWLVTSRLERYRPQTEAWLQARGIRYRELVMHPAETGRERLAAGDHAARKAQIYVSTRAWLFIESDCRQADEIARRSGKPVYCTDTRQLVQPGVVGSLQRTLVEMPRRSSDGASPARRAVRAARRVLRSR